MKITVLGNGGWGTALSLLLCENGHEVTLFGALPKEVEELAEKRENTRYLPGIPLPPELRLTAGESEAASGAELFLSVVPTPHLASVADRFRHRIGASTPVVSATKGVEMRTLRRPTAILKDTLGASRLAVLSGPSHAEEVARRLPASVVLASDDHELAEWMAPIFANDRFRIYLSDDVVGVELCGALKNTIALAAGISDGLGFGDNAKSALMTRGVVEMARLGVALGARRETFFGLAGIGDLITTCISPHGRNRSVGLRIGAGEKLQDILDSMEQVAEGVWTTSSIRDLSRKLGVELPITETLYRVLFENLDPREGAVTLMQRPTGFEI